VIVGELELVLSLNTRKLGIGQASPDFVAACLGQPAGGFLAQPYPFTAGHLRTVTPGSTFADVQREPRISPPGPVREQHVARHEPDAENIPDGEAQMIEQKLLAAERHAALREAFTYLSPRDQQLIALLVEDPPVPYTDISTRLGIAVGSIGPNRRRCLDKLRHHPAIAALISAEAQTV
jgi:hypothetical protein